MAVTRTGSIEYFESVANSGNHSITVPSDAEIVIVGVGGNRDVVNFLDLGNPPDDNTASLTINSVQMKVGRCEDSTSLTNECCGIFYLVNPATGSQTLAYDWSGSNVFTAGGQFYVAYYKGVDTADPIRDRGGEHTDDTDATTGTLTVSTGDMIVAVAEMYGADTDVIQWTNATEADQDQYNGRTMAIAENNNGVNVAITSYHATQVYHIVNALVLKVAAGEEGSVVPLFLQERRRKVV